MSYRREGQTGELEPLHIPRGSIGSALFCGLLAAAFAWAAYFLHFNLSTIGSLEFLLVVVSALRWGFASATVASLSGAFFLNFLFSPPVFSVTISDPENFVSLSAFEATALLVSRLSSNLRRRAIELEIHRRRNGKLYELSRAILLIDNQMSTADQLATLIRELIEVSSVSLWVIYDQTGSASTTDAAKEPARAAYLNGDDADLPQKQRAVRMLRIGTTPIGAMVLEGWKDDPLLANAVASLVAVAFERARALQKENRAEAQRNTEQLRTAVLDGLAHGFKTPLTAIQAASSGLLEINGLNEVQTELVTLIDGQATVLAKLTTRLLQTAALESKEMKLRRTTESMEELIDSLINEEMRDIRDRIELSVPMDLQPVAMDSQLVRLALVQLIDNAAKYATVGPPIKVNVVQSNLETIVMVENEGPEIKAEERERIFERFYRSQDILHGPTGTGLGLSIVKKTADSHGGRVWVESNPVFTRFSLAIPR